MVMLVSYEFMIPNKMIQLSIYFAKIKSLFVLFTNSDKKALFNSTVYEIDSL